MNMMRINFFISGIETYYNLQYGAGAGAIYYSYTNCDYNTQFRLIHCLSPSPTCTHMSTDVGISCFPCKLLQKCVYAYV